MIVPAALARRNGHGRAFRSACSGEGGGGAVSDALARRASSAALCRSSIARLLRSKRSDWAAVGPLHLPHALASCIRKSPLYRRKSDSRQYQAAATSHHRCRSGARVHCREAESPATSASPRQVLLFSNGKLPSLDDKWRDKWGEQLLLQATSSAPLRPATPRDGVLKAAYRATSGAADFASWPRR